MSISGGPDINEQGLVLAFDAANSKSYRSYSSLINTNSWILGSGGATGYSQNGSTSENERVLDTNPFGYLSSVWETRPLGTTDADGGWNSDWVSIDKTKLYRFSVWMRRTSSTSGGTFYLGLYGSPNAVIRTDTNLAEGNPYWECAATSKYTQNQWYLVVGHCYPHTQSGAITHNETGIYTISGGTTKVMSNNMCNIGSDVKWASDAVSTLHRTYHYYCADNTTRLQFFGPRIDAIDGTEPSIADLLSGKPYGIMDLSGNQRHGSFFKGQTFTNNSGGGLVFVGANNDFIDTNSNNIITGMNPFTIESWTNKTDGSYGAILGNYGTGYSTGLWWATAGLYIQGSVYHSDYATSMAGIHYSAVTRDGSGNVILYRDGIQVNSGVLGSSVPTNVNWRIGADVNGASEPLTGNIYSINAYNRVLSSSEILKNFNATRSRFGI